MNNDQSLKATCLELCGGNLGSAMQAYKWIAGADEKKESGQSVGWEQLRQVMESATMAQPMVITDSAGGLWAYQGASLGWVMVGVGSAEAARG